ncbi:MAG: hypothetical protein JST00_14190 [Deltaproteobacteria bacterium]|nr:hypothetical protein [Deltaproteobacteria bacterium]
MKTMAMVRGSVMAAVLAAGVLLTGTASARDEASGMSCVTDPLSMLTTCIGNAGGGGSEFLGAFASDNNGKGGWVEFYSDEDGEWWVEHHADGGTSVGWESGGGANYMNGPNLGYGSKEGTYEKKSKPTLKGKLTTGPKRSFASAKAAATKTTGTMATASAPASWVASSVSIDLKGTGQCKANIVVRKNGQFVSSSGIVPVSFPSKRDVPLPAALGDYQISVEGRDGCLGQTKSVVVKRVPMSLGGLMTK